MESGRFLSDEDVKKQANVCVLGQTVREKLFPNRADPIGQVVRVDQMTYRIVGVTRAKGRSPIGGDQDDQVFIPISTLQRKLVNADSLAMIITSILTMIYLGIRFDWRFGLAAVLSTAHDILVTFAFIKMMNLEVSLTVVAAILTLLGYSANDTIIIFDRVREDLRKRTKGESMAAVLDRAINETLPRSVMTHATTLAATLALLFFAGEVIRPFAWVMAFGVFVATFSSIYVAGPLLLYIESKFPRAASEAAGRAMRDPGTPPATAPTKPRANERAGAR